MNTRIEIAGPMRDRYDEILTDEALHFLAGLHARFSGRRHDQLAARMQRRFDLGNGRDLRFLPETSEIRADASWRVDKKRHAGRITRQERPRSGRRPQRTPLG